MTSVAPSAGGASAPTPASASAPLSSTASSSTAAAAAARASASASSALDAFTSLSLQQQQQQQRRRQPVSKVTLQRCVATKNFIEQRYRDLQVEVEERRRRRTELERQRATGQLDEASYARAREAMLAQERDFLRQKRQKLSVMQFEKLRLIGKGAFGKVYLVKSRDTGDVYAMKKIRKADMVTLDKVHHVRAERDLLVGSLSAWFTTLYYSFQDDEYLYLVMEYVPGGDLMTWLERLNVFDEAVARFYAAQLVLAVEAMHRLGYIHRDLKPDNVLLDRHGHVKLTDFGLCAPLRRAPMRVSTGIQIHEESVMEDPTAETGVPSRERLAKWHQTRRKLYSQVGTSDYMAPEVIDSESGYTAVCDWWSVGCIVFECLAGYAPFSYPHCAPDEVRRRVRNFERVFRFPAGLSLSPVAVDFVSRLIARAEHRLGSSGGADEIKRHPFFAGVDWEHLREGRAPLAPSLTSLTDTSHFPVYADDEDDGGGGGGGGGDTAAPEPSSSTGSRPLGPSAPAAARGASLQQRIAQSKHLHFVGFTFKRFEAMRPGNVFAQRSASLAREQAAAGASASVGTLLHGPATSGPPVTVPPPQ